MTIRSPLLLLALAACMKAPEPPAAPADPHAGLQMPRPAAAPPLLFEMAAPEGWRPLPPDQSFYLAKWALPGEGGGLCTVSASVGGVEINIQRWLGQFEGAGGASARETARIQDLSGAPYPTTTVVCQGTLADTRQVGGGPPRTDWMLAGAAIESPHGPVFVKAVGPRSVLEPVLEQLWAAVRKARIEHEP